MSGDCNALDRVVSALSKHFGFSEDAEFALSSIAYVGAELLPFPEGATFHTLAYQHLNNLATIAGMYEDPKEQLEVLTFLDSMYFQALKERPEAFVVDAPCSLSAGFKQLTSYACGPTSLLLRRVQDRHAPFLSNDEEVALPWLELRCIVYETLLGRPYRGDAGNYLHKKSQERAVVEQQ